MASSAASRNKPIVARYARALLQLANKHNQAEAIRVELKALAQVLEGSMAFRAIISDLSVSEGTRQNLITKTFTGRLSPVMMNFLGLVNSKGRLGLLPDIIDAYDDLLEEQLGNVEVD